MPKVETKMYTVACAKCGHVFNQYLAARRRASEAIISGDGGESLALHFAEARHKDVRGWPIVKVVVWYAGYLPTAVTLLPEPTLPDPGFATMEEQEAVDRDELDQAIQESAPFSSGPLPEGWANPPEAKPCSRCGGYGFCDCDLLSGG